MTEVYDETSFSEWFAKTVDIKELYLVYVFWAENNRPLYVGYTTYSGFKRRMNSHYAISQVKRHVHRCTVVFDTFSKQEALRKENTTIVDLQPLWNKNGRECPPALASKPRKRANGRGAKPYKRKDGRWMASYTAQTTAGPKRRYLYADTYPECEHKLREALMTLEDSSE